MQPPCSQHAKYAKQKAKYAQYHGANSIAKYAPPTGSLALADSDSPDVAPQAASCSSYEFFKHHGPESRSHCHSTLSHAAAPPAAQFHTTVTPAPSLARPFKFATGQVTGRVMSRHDADSDSESGPQGQVTMPVRPLSEPGPESESGTGSISKPNTY